ncbi:MAG: DUF3179 domain-containing protein [Acidobacteriota bacterium]|nr:DUF3179 domain-containing protein [Acidobacteriota bacterium]
MRPTVILLLIVLSAVPATALKKKRQPELSGLHFLKLLAAQDITERRKLMREIGRKWHESYIPIMLEAGNFAPDPKLKQQIFGMLVEKTGREFTGGLDEWYVWWWRKKRPEHPDYADFKAALFSNIDPTFRRYFGRDRPTTIRLDEVRWGGVVRDGIPPLRNPKMITAAEASYLEDDHVVFALSVNGDARAYPKRILGWHEMFVDTVGGEPVCGVYCTLCGTMILYKTTVGGKVHQMGTSGFLYRSNKLMYDQETFSLWNTLWGKPVIGPLVGQNIELPRLSVVTTTWGEWRRRHPDTKVLDLNTGYDRNYDEGEAYRQYFATDKLMFSVPKRDRRLKNKAEVLGLVFKDVPGSMAVSVKFLKKKPIYQNQLGNVRFVILTDKSGAARVYERGSLDFESWDGTRARDKNGGVWEVNEHALVSPAGTVLKRLPAHRAFWFGWASAFEDTKLIK